MQWNEWNHVPTFRANVHISRVFSRIFRIEYSKQYLTSVSASDSCFARTLRHLHRHNMPSRLYWPPHKWCACVCVCRCRCLSPPIFFLLHFWMFARDSHSSVYVNRECDTCARECLKWSTVLFYFSPIPCASCCGTKLNVGARIQFIGNCTIFRYALEKFWRHTRAHSVDLLPTPCHQTPGTSSRKLSQLLTLFLRIIFLFSVRSMQHNFSNFV